MGEGLPPAVPTDSLHHAGLPRVRLHWNDILEAMQRDDALIGIPHLENVLHFGTQLLSHREEMDSVQHTHTISHLFKC